MKGWASIRLDEVITCNSHSIGKGFQYQDIYYYDISAVGSGSSEDPKLLALQDAPSRAKRLVKRGNTIISTVRPANRSFYYFKETRRNDVVSTGFAVLEAKENLIDPRFLYYIVTDQKFTDYLVSVEKGANYPAVNPDDIKNAEISLPPLPTQKRIAGILSAYDDLIENNLRRIKLLEELAQITYEEWFVRFRFPSHESTPINPTTNLPEGWKSLNINEVYRIKYGKNLPQTKISDSGTFPVYGASGVMGYYNESNCNEKVALITSRGNGSGDVHRTYEEAFVTNNSFMVLKNEQFKNIPLVFTIENLKRANLKSYCSGAAQPQLTNDSIKFLEIILPDTNLISQFDTICSPYLEIADKLRSKNTLLKEARDILLPRLMTGIIDVDQYHPENLMKDAA